ncbi:hypothetical protein ABPG75_005497 [Micractinium tetrahymenae]
MLMQAGAAPTAQALQQAVWVACPELVRALLVGGRIEVPGELPPDRTLELWGSFQHNPHPIELAYPCPILTALQLRAAVTNRPVAGSLLQIVDELTAAGYRPATYRNVMVKHALGAPPQAVPLLDPVVDDPRLQLGGTNRWLWLAVQRPAWSPTAHHRFLPRFKRVVRTLLLVAERQRRSGGSGSPGALNLADLPPEVLLRICGLAAYPLSCWMAGGGSSMGAT